MKKFERGVSLIELVIGLTVLSLISVAVGTSFLNIFSNQQNVSNQSTITGIDAALSNYFSTSTFCDNSLKNLAVSNQERPLEIKGFSGAGSNGGVLRSGTLIDDQVMLSNATIKLNNTLPSVDTYFNGSTAQARVVDISYNFKSKKAFSESNSANDPNAWMERKKHTKIVPVKIQSGRIVSCEGSNSAESACAATGGSWENGKCEPKESCVYKGTFIRWTCQGVRNDSSCGSSFANVLSTSQGQVIIGGTNGGVMNPRTGAFSCPSGSTKTFTGRDTHQYTLSCGKKCSYTVTQAADFYSCRKCDGD